MGSDSASPMATPPAEWMVEDRFGTEQMVNISGTPPG
jgi:hypothetical protein